MYLYIWNPDIWKTKKTFQWCKKIKIRQKYTMVNELLKAGTAPLWYGKLASTLARLKSIWLYFMGCFQVSSLCHTREYKSRIVATNRRYSKNLKKQIKKKCINFCCIELICASQEMKIIVNIYCYETKFFKFSLWCTYETLIRTKK